MKCAFCAVPLPEKSAKEICDQCVQEMKNAPKPNSGPTPEELAASAGAVTTSEKVTGFNCPDCEDKPLRVGSIGNCQVCYCPECEGFVIDRASLGDLIESLRTSYEGPEDKPVPLDPNAILNQTQCPACFETMETFPYCGPGNVVIDTCEGCKLTWLDSGEMAQIVRAPGRRDYGLKSAESEMLKAQIYEQAQSNGMTALMMLSNTVF